MKNLKVEYIGKSKHYVSEDVPHKIGRSIKSWVENLNNGTENNRLKTNIRFDFLILNLYLQHRSF